MTLKPDGLPVCVWSLHAGASIGRSRIAEEMRRKRSTEYALGCMTQSYIDTATVHAHHELLPVYGIFS